MPSRLSLCKGWIPPALNAPSDCLYAVRLFSTAEFGKIFNFDWLFDEECDGYGKAAVGLAPFEFSFSPFYGVFDVCHPDSMVAFVRFMGFG